MDAETKAYFERINKKLNLLLEKKKRETWVSVSWVASLTGWDPEKMRQAREQSIVKCKRSKTGGWLYLLESIPSQFILNK